MKRHFLLGILGTVLLLLAACSSTTNESTVKQTEDQPTSTNPSEKSDQSDSKENDSNMDNSNVKIVEDNGQSENVHTTNEEESVDLKEEYLNKLNETKKKVEEMRENPMDETTFALKKIEGDAFDILDGMLNEIYGVLEETLPTEEMEQLRIEQREWLDYRDNTAKEASLQYKGGTMEQYEYVRVENNLTQERCFELVENYMK
ncbi:lysozyme inhibitor LprI family protein [Gracilibacillus dipsosauri]|uniref:lysozyme inhibitor LprI family protein n=1 Tax=Gracilibacillus dipsosauri TaxID=178340 RepID=UPI00240A170A